MHKTSLARKKVLTLLERSSLCPPICYHIIFLGTPTAAFNNHKELSAVWRQNTCTSICCFGPSRGATLPSASCFTSSPSPSPDLHPAALITSLHVNKLNISWVNGSWRQCFCKHFFLFIRHHSPFVTLIDLLLSTSAGLVVMTNEYWCEWSCYKKGVTECTWQEQG